MNINLIEKTTRVAAYVVGLGAIHAYCERKKVDLELENEKLKRLLEAKECEIDSLYDCINDLREQLDK